MSTQTLYRIENPETGVGLWYREDGAQVDFIKEIPGAKCADLPMGHDPDIVGGWYSAAHSPEAMAEWITADDAQHLAAAGHLLYAVEVLEGGWRMTEAPYVHAVFRREAVLSRREVPFDALPLSRALEVAA